MTLIFLDEDDDTRGIGVTVLCYLDSLVLNWLMVIIM